MHTPDRDHLTHTAAATQKMIRTVHSLTDTEKTQWVPRGRQVPWGQHNAHSRGLLGSSPPQLPPDRMSPVKGLMMAPGIFSCHEPLRILIRPRWSLRNAHSLP